MEMRNWPNSTFQKGFALLQVGLVLSILLVLLTITLARAPFFHSFFLKSEIIKLSFLCKYLQRLAIATHQNQMLSFDIAKNGYSTQSGFYRFPREVKFGCISGAQGPPSHPEKEITSFCTFKNNQIHFYPNGTIDSGSIYLTDSGHNYMYALTIPPAYISFIRLYKYADTWVVL